MIAQGMNLFLYFESDFCNGIIVIRDQSRNNSENSNKNITEYMTTPKISPICNIAIIMHGGSATSVAKK